METLMMMVHVAVTIEINAKEAMVIIVAVMTGKFITTFYPLSSPEWFNWKNL